MSPQSHQALFDAKYISGNEIRKRLGLAPCSITLAHQRGFLPKPIKVGASTHIWIRAEIEPILVQWAEKLKRTDVLQSA